MTAAGYSLRMHYYHSRDPRMTVLGAVRGVFRLVHFVLAFLAAAISTVALYALLPDRLRSRWGRSIRMAAGRRLTAAAGVRVRRTGTRPATAAMVVANHLSWLDSFLFMGELGPRFVASSTWGAIPLLRIALRANGVIFINRHRLRDSHAVGRALARRVERGDQMMVFPEADTSRGAAVLAFRPALLQPAATMRLPVAWAALRYRTPPGWPPAGVVVSWADWTPLLLHIYRAFHPPWIEAQIVYGREPVTGSDRKALAAELYRAVDRAMVPQDQLAPDELARIHVPPKQPLKPF